MFASLILRQADLATTVEWIEIHFDIYIYIWKWENKFCTQHYKKILYFV